MAGVPAREGRAQNEKQIAGLDRSAENGLADALCLAAGMQRGDAGASRMGLGFTPGAQPGISLEWRLIWPIFLTIPWN
ncbi:hypothetical protein [Comamonas endophytica]|uniref:Uncharacterized protein n=1 Tax=Comamonas endophytica TaxID=2949090 RepID=A0ABY6GGE8_9BURK|nr:MULTISPECIES: hypothetical protein [unclassified Acidovorax]MCD2513202.1 hypothetical protein [Acidovorax sp. D4N7]UYG53452.1 hypothetical protein M9799_18955 [Acidovorax sp. 5MLIR]